MHVSSVDTREDLLVGGCQNKLQETWLGTEISHVFVLCCLVNPLSPARQIFQPGGHEGLSARPMNNKPQQHRDKPHVHVEVLILVS